MSDIGHLLITMILICTNFTTESIEGTDGKHFVALGCYRDSKHFRALPELVANLRGNINWREMEKTVKDCAHKVVLKNSTYRVTAYAKFLTTVTNKTTN